MMQKMIELFPPVSRLWSISSGGYVLFCWDNFFAGYMASFGNKALAYSNLKEILNEQTDAGFIPNFAYATGQCSADRSQPPVGSAMLLEVYKRFGAALESGLDNSPMYDDIPLQAIFPDVFLLLIFMPFIHQIFPLVDRIELQNIILIRKNFMVIGCCHL